MIVTEETRKQSEVAWDQVEEIRKAGEFDDEALAIYIGYANAHGMEQGINLRSALPENKRDRIDRLMKAKTPEEARSLVNGAATREPKGATEDDAWDDVAAAAQILAEAIERAAGPVPAWALSDRLRRYKDFAKELIEDLG